mgnify:CR=1 FL=1
MNLVDVKTDHLGQLADYTRTLYRAPELRKLFFELTLQCNERCFHCGSSCAPGLVGADDLTRDEWLGIIDQVKADFDISRMQLCITGGEPTLHKGLPDLIEKIREMGYLIKLDTNGYRPDDLIMLCETGMIDYVAMDIKNSPEKYAATVGLNEESFDIERIRRSVDYIMSSEIPCEFRTTVVREFHTEEDMEKIGEWLKGAQKFCLQQFTDSANVIQPGLNACTLEEILSFRKILGKYIPNVVIRGISED